jgi:hypothetical protein
VNAMKAVLQEYLQNTRALMLAKLDGQGGKDAGMLDEAGWSTYYTTIKAAAETFRHG